MTASLRGRPGGALLIFAIVALALTTANIHLGLGGFLFTLNGLGYLGLAGLFVIAAAVRHPLVEEFSWLPRLMLIGYTALTIVGYLVMGSYFSLGWLTKGIELALIALLTLDVLRVYGSPIAFVRTALDTTAARVPNRFRPTAS